MNGRLQKLTGRTETTEAASCSGRTAASCSRPLAPVRYATSRLVAQQVKLHATQQASSSRVETPGQQKAEVDAAYQAGSEYLRSIGIENRAELARILDVATNPNSLFHAFRDAKRDSNPLARKLDVQEDLTPVVEFLLSEGFSQKEVCKIIIAYPAVLCYSPDDRLQPFFTYLRELGIAQPDRTVLQRPSLLGLTADKNLRQMIDYLQQNSYTTEQIEKLLATTL